MVDFGVILKHFLISLNLQSFWKKFWNLSFWAIFAVYLKTSICVLFSGGFQELLFLLHFAGVFESLILVVFCRVSENMRFLSHFTCIYKISDIGIILKHFSILLILPSCLKIFQQLPFWPRFVGSLNISIPGLFGKLYKSNCF